jgi:hypothetical protein
MQLIVKLEDLALIFLFAFVNFEYCSGSWLM